MRVHGRTLLHNLFFVALIAALGVGWTVYASATSPQQLTRYDSDKWHFSISVPADVKVDDVENQGDAQIIQFSDPNADHVFEDYAAPYTQMDVALGREGAPNDASDQPLNLGVINVYHDDMLRYAFHRNGIEYTITVLPRDEGWFPPSSNRGSSRSDNDSVGPT